MLADSHKLVVLAMRYEMTVHQINLDGATAGEINIFHFLFKVVCVISAAGDVHSSGDLCTNDGGASLSW